MEVKVTGASDLARVARALRGGSKSLKRKLDRGLRAAATRDVATAIRDKSPDYMPKGYEAVFRSSLEFTTQVRTAYEVRVTLIVRARGARGHDRKVRELEEGRLRAPNWGRWRKRRGINRRRHKTRNKWHQQRIRAHFATEPAQNAAPAVRDRIDAVVHSITQQIERSG